MRRNARRPSPPCRPLLNRLLCHVSNSIPIVRELSTPIVWRYYRPMTPSEAAAKLGRIRTAKKAASSARNAKKATAAAAKAAALRRAQKPTQEP